MEDQMVAEKGDSSSAQDLASSGVDPALVEKSPALDKGKAVDTGDDHPLVGEGDATDSVLTNHLFDSSSARGNFLQFRYDGPDRLCEDKVACSELIYSVKGSEDPYPNLGGLAEKEGYERFARAQVRCLVLANEVVANYNDELAHARKEAESARKEAEKEKEESARLRAQVEELKASNERLKNRLRYLKEIEVPSGRLTQIRGTLKMAELLREKRKIDIPRDLTDKMARDLELHKDQLKEIAEVKLNDEDLL